jgi:chemotaxis protein methyltransferase CheR
MAVISDETESFQYIFELVHQRCGIRLHDGKEALVRARLGKRMRLHGFETLFDYCDFLKRQADEQEFTQVVDALTTNFTSFLRESDHMKFMVEQLGDPRLLGGRKDFQVWSAACATGEEPYTIAFFLFEFFPPQHGWDWQIIASDVSTKAIAKAQAGIYPAERVAAVPPEWLPRYFQQGQNRWQDFYRVKPMVAQRVRFCQLNLLGKYEFRRPFEVIFCRNVMIYFDRPTQERLVNRLCQCLAPRGYLLVGHSESLNGLSVPLRCLRPSIYQKP